MRFRISTILFSVALIAILCGWWLDYSMRNRREIVGAWRYPTPDAMMLGYRTTFEIRPDGTFSKIQRYRTSATRFDGRYTTNDDGTITFHFLAATTETSISSRSSDAELPSESIDVKATCRCGIDKSGYLIIRDTRFSSVEEIGIQFESYVPTDSPLPWPALHNDTLVSGAGDW